MNASGVDTIMAQFHGRFDVLGPGHHFMHDVQIDFEGNDQARGRVSGHAELWRRGQMMVTAIRYDDIYRNTADGRSEEHKSELQSLMRTSYAVLVLIKQKKTDTY